MKTIIFGGTTEGGWQAELAPHYATAERMLGLATNPYPGLQDEWLRETARRKR